MKRRRETVDAVVADAIAADLPDGAYWALMEELTGIEPIEVAMDLDADLRTAVGTRKRRKRRG